MESEGVGGVEKAEVEGEVASEVEADIGQSGRGLR